MAKRADDLSVSRTSTRHLRRYASHSDDPKPALFVEPRNRIGRCQFSHRLDGALASDLRWIVLAFMASAYLLFPRAILSEALFLSASIVIAITAASLALRSAKREDPSERLSDDFAIAALVAKSAGDKAKCDSVAKIYVETLASAAEREAFRENVDWYVGWYAIQGGTKFFRM